MRLTNLFGKVLLVWVTMSCQATFAQGPSDQKAALQNDPMGKIVMTWYGAWINKDWNAMTQVLADGFTFTSPLDDHINVKAMKEKCWPNAGMIKRFDVITFAVNGDHAFVICNGYNTDGKLFRNSDYFKFKDGKITAYECFFGPGINYPTSGK